MKTEPERLKWCIGIWRSRYEGVLRDYAAQKKEHEKVLQRIAKGKLT